MTSSNDIYTRTLQKYWGYSTFRALQHEIIESIGNAQDTLGLMPTGGGKSLTFQVPTMAMEGLCLVITPLIALMKDQVDNLKKKGIKAAAIYTGMTSKDIARTIDNCKYGDYKFLYLSPERLGTKMFLENIDQLPVCLIAVDESHCISQWGYDFRPSYLKIAEIRELLPNIPILALTATATPEVVIDIQEKLHFKAPNVFRKSFERTNLVYAVRYIEDKNEQLLKILRAVPGTSVVYVRNRKRTKEMAEFIQANGISATFFHAGLSNEVKDLRQKQWKDDQTRVIVATNAFGMGIDKANVRTVIHLDLPDTLEAYFQEAGRAGRDEQKAYAILLYDKNDIGKIKKRASDNYPEKDFIRLVYNKLGNYFQVAIGSGFERTFTFDIDDFCATYKLPIITTHSALKILQQAGYIETSDESSSSSRIMFTLTKDELNRTSLSEMQERIVFILLRSYTGLFTDTAYINEELIAKRIGITRKLFYDECLIMSKMHIIKYIPRKQMPSITFICERVLAEKVSISTAVYEKRKELFIKKTTSMLEYATQTQFCRSQVLLSYFGEKNSPICNQCDVCLSHKRTNLQDIEYNNIKTETLRLVNDAPLPYAEINSHLIAKGYKQNKIGQTLRLMQDNGEINMSEAMQVSPAAKQDAD